MEKIFDDIIYNYDKKHLSLDPSSSFFVDSDYIRKFLEFLKKEKIQNRVLYVYLLTKENIVSIDENYIYTNFNDDICTRETLYEEGLYIITAYENNSLFLFNLIKFENEYTLNKYKLMKTI